MKPEKERSPWLWLLLIPIQLVIVGLSFLGGIAIDGMIFSGGGEGQGHGMPIFTMILPIITLIVLAVAVVVALIGLTVGLIRQSRRRKARAQQPTYPPQYGQYPQYPPPQWQQPGYPQQQSPQFPQSPQYPRQQPAFTQPYPQSPTRQTPPQAPPKDAEQPPPAK